MVSSELIRDADLGYLEVHAVDHCNLSCLGCNHWSPFYAARSYTFQDYRPWLDLLLGNGVRAAEIGISGGEPFLNHDLEGLVAELAGYGRPLICYTNLTWLRDEGSIGRWAPVLARLGRLWVSRYRPVVERIGVQRTEELLDAIRTRFPGVRIGSFEPGIVERFGQVEFYEMPVATGPDHDCPLSGCVQLTAAGGLLRCPTARAIGRHPGMTAGFAENRDLAYRLWDSSETRRLDDWRHRWPLDACAYCGCGSGRGRWGRWTSDTRIRRADGPGYADMVESIALP